MRALHIKRLLGAATAVAALACAWFFFAPAALGGRTTYVVTDGISMEPRFHTGDLALVHSQASYHVGEIVAYYNRMLHTIVLHRIIGREGSRYLFKGDNNNFVDFEHPTPSQLIGSLWLHLPDVGARLQSIGSPVLIGILFGLGALLFSGAAFTRRVRRRRRRRRAEGGVAQPHAHGPGRPLHAVVALATIALVPFLGLALLAFTHSARAHVPFTTPYKQSGALSYSATASPGPVYPDDRAVTGDPLFTRVLSDVDLSFDYSFAAGARHAIAGVASLDAAMSSSTGWHTVLALAPPVSFRGDHAVITATLELGPLLALMRRVQADTGVNGAYTLTLVPRVAVNGQLDAAALHTVFAPHIQFSVSEFELEPAAASAAASSAPGAASQFAPSTAGSLAGVHSQAGRLSFGVARLPVTRAREIALGGIAVLALLLLACAALTKPTAEDEVAAILARYGPLIVPVSRVWQLPGVAVIDVASMDALVRVAEHYDRSILHEINDWGDWFWVTDESGQFRFAVAGYEWTSHEDGDGEVAIEQAADQPWQDEDTHVWPDGWVAEPDGAGPSADYAQPAIGVGGEWATSDDETFVLRDAARFTEP